MLQTEIVSALLCSQLHFTNHDIGQAWRQHTGSDRCFSGPGGPLYARGGGGRISGGPEETAACQTASAGGKLYAEAGKLPRNLHTRHSIHFDTLDHALSGSKEIVRNSRSIGLFLKRQGHDVKNCEKRYDGIALV